MIGSLLKTCWRSEVGINKEVARLATGESIAFETEPLDCLIGSSLCNYFVSDLDKEATRLAIGDSADFGTGSRECSTWSLMKDCCISEF